MRIISGKYRGRILRTMQGRDVRPTTDRVKEAMFSSLTSICGNFENLCVLDAFAGSGSLGFESISRGAKTLVSFENNKKVYEILLDNSMIFNEDNCDIKLMRADITKTNFEIICKNMKFDILFFDPPYVNDAQIILEILAKFNKLNLLANGAIVVYEHSAKNNVDSYKDNFSIENFELINDKIYGEIAVDYFKFLQE